MKLKLMVMAALAACSAVAMPTDEQIEKANKEVQASLKKQIAAWQGGDITDGDLAALLLRRSDRFKDEAQRYACLQMAFEAAVRVADVSLAADILEKVAADTKDFGKEDLRKFRRKAFKKDAPEFYTMKGERVRSKSEVIIADRLRANGIPYRYECPLQLGNKLIHPDFTILRMSDRKILYHEHCGKMADQQYIEDMLVRAKDYNRAGIILGDRLFYTFESDTTPLDMTILDNLINQHYR